MLQIQKILFPTDFSECAEHAFSQAAHLAAQYDAELHVLNIVVPGTEDPDQPMRHLKDVEAGEDVGLTHTAEEDVRLFHIQETGFSEARGILEYAAREDVDLIVMGTHGRRGLGRLLLGSVAEEVARLSPVPVLTVCPWADAGGRRPIRRILAPVDFSESTREVLTHAKALAATYEAEVDLLHVITEVALPGVYGIEPISVANPAVRKRVEEALIAEMADSPGAEVPFAVHVLVGLPARDIVDYATDLGADMIVLATHGRTGLKRLMMGSVAENVVRSAPCPVFTLKSFGKSLVEEGEAVAAKGTAPVADEAALVRGG